jgi:predicted RNase H-like HicB family nuclease
MIFEYAGDDIIIHSPDIKEVYSDAKTISEAYKNAQEVLLLSLKSRLQCNEEIPIPSDIREIKVDNGFVSLVLVVCNPTHEPKVKYDKKTLSIPHDINVAAIKAGINFSKVLHQGLLQELSRLGLNS